MTGPDLSQQANEFLRTCIRDDAPTDFSRIVQIREEIQTNQSSAVERAIERHQLEREVTLYGGIECERIISKKSGVRGGTLFYLFGGGFITGSPYCDLPIIGALAEGCQVEVIAPKYRLAPEHPAPTAANDVFTAWQEASNIAAAPLLLAGESAGGNLAVGLVQQATAADIRLPDAVALLSPAVDLRTDPTLLEPTLNADPTMRPGRVTEVATTYAPARDLRDAEISPLFGSFDNFPPTLITTGTRDLLLAMCLRLYRQMKRANVDIECRVWDGLWHVFEYYDNYPEAAESLAEIAVFLTEKSARVNQ